MLISLENEYSVLTTYKPPIALLTEGTLKGFLHYYQ